MIVDGSGRRARKLRISVTTRCGLACAYCGPAARVHRHGEFLPASEIARIAAIAVEEGIEAIRITGGEPLNRPDIREIYRALSGLPASKGITTNGQWLSRHASDLARAGFGSANVSLDSLDAGVFARITGGGSLDRTLEGIRAAQVEGLEVKVNCVVLRGVNDHEAPSFHDLAASTGIEVRFLELLPAGDALDLVDAFVPASETIARVEAHAGPLDWIPSPVDSTAFLRRSDRGARLGFIAGRSAPFCGACSRLRLSADGILHPCLFREEGIPLAGESDERIRSSLSEAFERKPSLRPDRIERPLRAVGG